MPTLTISTRSLVAALLALAAVELGLCYAHASQAMLAGTGFAAVPIRWLNIDGEGALHAWFSSCLLAIAAAMMLASHLIERRAGRRTTWGWLVVAVGLAYLSIDEMTGVHENFGRLTEGLHAVWPIFTHRWVIVGLPLVGAAAFLLAPFLLALPRATALRLALAGTVFVAGGIGLELLNGAVLAAQGESFSYLLLVCFEEILELLGIILAIRAVSLHIAGDLGGGTLRIARPSAGVVAPAPADLEFDPRRLLVLLAAATASVLALGYAREIAALAQGIPSWDFGLLWIGLNAELSLPAWYSSLLLAIAALLMFWIAGAERLTWRPTVLGWLLLGIGFVYLSIDEMISLHETFGDFLRHLPDPTGLLFHRWVIVGMPLAALVALVFLPFILRLPRPTAIRLVVAGGIYVLGAIGMEMINGAARASQGFSVTWLVFTQLEESFELLGVALAIRCLALHLADELAGPALRLVRAA